MNHQLVIDAKTCDLMMHGMFYRCLKALLRLTDGVDAANMHGFDAESSDVTPPRMNEIRWNEQSTWRYPKIFFLLKYAVEFQQNSFELFLMRLRDFERVTRKHCACAVFPSAANRCWRTRAPTETAYSICNIHPIFVTRRACLFPAIAMCCSLPATGRCSLL